MSFALENIFNNNPSPIVVVNFDGKVLFENKRWKEKFKNFSLNNLTEKSLKLLKYKIKNKLDLKNSEYTRINLEFKDGTKSALLFSLDFESKVIVMTLSYEIAAIKKLKSKLQKEKRFYETILNNLPVAVFSKNANMNFTFLIWNRYAESMFGLKSQDVIGKTDYDFFPKEQADFFRDKDLSVMKNNSEIEISEEPVDSSNGRIWLQTKKVPFHDPINQSSYLIGITENITARKNYLTKLNIALKALNIGVWEWVVNGDKLIWDKGMESIYKRSAEEIDTSEKWLAVLHEDDREKMKNDVKEIIEGKGTTEVNSEFRIILPDNSVRFIKNCFTKDLRPDGTVERYIGVNWDITEEILKDEEIRKQQALGFHVSKLKTLGEMASGIAHEINNPISIICSASSILKKIAKSNDNFDRERLMSKIELIENTAFRISKIAQGLRAFAGVSEKEEFKLCSIKEILKDTIELCRQKFIQENVELLIEEAPNVFFHGRGVQISQVIMNLLSNSFDAVSSLNEKWIKISFSQNDGHLFCHVTDSGKGIAPEIAEKLLTPFFSTKGSGKGMGLGLSISAGILHEHSGNLFLDSNNANTSFVIMLPLAQTDLKAA